MNDIKESKITDIGKIITSVSAPLIFSRIAAVLKDVDYISKDHENKAQGFKFRGIDDVMNEIHALFVKHEIFVIPEVLEKEVKEKLTSKGSMSQHMMQKIKYTFFATDGSSVSSTVIGEAADFGDKASNKCMSMALKYVLLQTFMIPTEETKYTDESSPEFVKPLPTLEEKMKKDPSDEKSPKTLESISNLNEVKFKKYGNGKWKEVVCHFGTEKLPIKGKKLSELTPGNFHFMRTVWKPKLFNGTIDGNSQDLRDALDVAHFEYEKAKSEGVQDHPEDHTQMTEVKVGDKTRRLNKICKDCNLEIGDVLSYFKEQGYSTFEEVEENYLSAIERNPVAFSKNIKN